jgi:Tetratricopeptide repeat/TIR domain
MADRPPGWTEAQHFVISFAGVDRAWAVWTRHRLERLGHTADLQRWDLSGDTEVGQALGYLLRSGRKVVLILSTWYFRLGPRRPAEWNEALSALPQDRLDQITTFVVAEVGLPEAVALLSPVNLVDVDETEADRRLLRGLRLPAAPAPTAAPHPEPHPEPGGAPRFPGAPSAVWGSVPRRNRGFTGRDQLLEEMRQQLLPDEMGGRPCVLVGMSGVGKSQLASEYAHRFQPDYDVVWWVPARDRAVMRQELSRLAGQLGLRTGLEVGEQIRTVLDALRVGDPYARWLVVLDGADELAQATELLPTGRGHVIITSRNTDWRGTRAAVLEVPVYSEAEAVAFVQRRTPRLDRGEAHALAEALGRLPLMLDHATGWLDDSAMTVTEYIDRLQRGEDLENASRTSPEYPDTFQETLAIMLSQLRDANPLAVQVLRLCACFGQGRVPVQLVRPVTAKDLPESLREVANEPLRWHESIAVLQRFSVIKVEYPEPGHEAQAGGQVIELHRMVQLATKAGMAVQEREEMMRTVRQMLAAADPGTPEDSSSWPRYADILPHLAPSGALRSTNPVIQDLVINVLRYLYMRGEYRTGQDLAAEASAAWEAEQGPQHPRVWDLRLNEAGLFRALADYTTSERLSREAVEYLRAERDPADLELLRAMGGFGADLRALGRYQEAHELSTALWQRNRDLLGDDDPRTLSAKNNLSVGLRLMGKYGQALDLDREVLASREQVLGWAHPFTLVSASECARDLRLLGRYDEALSRQEYTLRRGVEALGQNHPLTLRALHHLGLCLRRTGEMARAEELLRSAVQRSDRLLGPDHPDALAVQADLGNHLRENGDLGESLGIAETVRQGYARAFGDQHPYTVGADGNHALVLRALGERQAAVALMDTVLPGLDRTVGADHPWTIGALVNSSSCRNLLGDVAVASEQSREGLRRARKTLGTDHPLTLTCGIAYAADLRALGRREEAAGVEDEMMERLSHLLGPNHPHTRSARTRQRPYWDTEFLST